MASAKEIATGYALAGVTLCMGVYFNLKIGPGGVGEFVFRTLEFMAAVLILKYTFEWGRHRGFPVGRADGTIAVGNLIRNLVMSAIVLGAVAAAFGPLMLLVVLLAR